MKRLVWSFIFSMFILSGEKVFADTCSGSTCSISEGCCQECGFMCGGGYTHINYRSQGWNIPREMSGLNSIIDQLETDNFNFAFSITPEYSESFSPCKITNYLIGEDLVNGKLIISGTRKGFLPYKVREKNEWLADYFGLATNFISEVVFDPRIKNFVIDIGLYFGFSNILKGAFFRIQAPLTYTLWELNMREFVTLSAVSGIYGGFEAGYMGVDAINSESLPEDFSHAIKGVKWGDMQDPIKYGKIDRCSCDANKVRFADIEMVLGCNFLQDEDYNFGLGVMISLPTGNKQDMSYVFAPVVGNGGHVEIGGVLTCGKNIWESDDQEVSIWMYCDAKVSHLFRRKLIRSFDLVGKPNSRYMLIQEIKKPAANLYTDVDTPSTYQYADKLYPLINKTTFCANVNFSVQGEVAIKFTYNAGNFSFDLGYNLWGRSGEKRCGTFEIEENKYALKGDSFVVGFSRSDESPSGLAATQSEATINRGTNTRMGVAFELEDRQNPIIDSPVPAWYDSAATNQLDSPKTIKFQTNTSIDPIFIKSSDINTAKLPGAISHKLFGNLGYAWKDEVEEWGWMPFIAVGGEVELSGEIRGTHGAVSQWGMWIKGGLSY